MTTNIIEFNIRAKPKPIKLSEDKQVIATYLLSCGIQPHMATLIASRVLRTVSLDVPPCIIVDEGFEWADTPEGFQFWCSFYDSIS